MVTTSSSRVPAPRPTARPEPSTGAAPVGQGVRAPRLYSMDGLRFLAAWGVLLYHFTTRWSSAWGTDPGEVFPAFGQVAMYFALAPELFFLISGFVILWTAWGRSVPAVVASRLARLYPTYWAALALTSFLLLVVWPEGKRISLTEVAVNVTLLQEAFGVRHVDGVYWTLWTELRFYLLIVLFVAIGITRRRVLVFAAAWPVVALLVQVAGWQTAEMLLISRYAPLFAGGMLLYLIHRDGHRLVPWLLVGGNLVLAIYHVVPAQMASLGRNTAFDPSPVLLGLVVVACFVTVAALSMTRLSRVSWPALTAMGALTYPLYLIHEFWGWWVIHLLHDVLPVWLTLAAACLASFALAWLIHHGVEKRVNLPARRWLERRLTQAFGRRDRSRAEEVTPREARRPVPVGASPP
ncbi:acyltransferase [Actinotalea sp. K2]|uniref:acyltransferase family protein n=1 Tax=Actinotalea sp. K2 TaxID=2939438 RepID=UPI002016DFA5|nr:acyltransferase [Actinotalea sp. K2]MCL3862736.1 acyltransferase [Actinotalea sp. K2]